LTDRAQASLQDVCDDVVHVGSAPTGEGDVHRRTRGRRDRSAVDHPSVLHGSATLMHDDEAARTQMLSVRRCDLDDRQLIGCPEVTTHAGDPACRG
jgi:hypothetical protein